MAWCFSNVSQDQCHFTLTSNSWWLFQHVSRKLITQKYKAAKYRLRRSMAAAKLQYSEKLDSFYCATACRTSQTTGAPKATPSAPPHSVALWEWFWPTFRAACQTRHIRDLKYAYQPNSSSLQIMAALHISLSHLQDKDTDIRMLFINFSCTF